MKNKQLSFSICLPVYKGTHVLKKALESILKQNFSNLEIIIGDDNPPGLKEEIKKTQEIIKSFHNSQIKYFKNEKNLGYPKNIQKIITHARNDIIFLLGQDDILSNNALQKTHDAFFLDKDIGTVTRPYFWFEDDIDKPVRVVRPPNSDHDTILSINNGEKDIKAVFGSIGQLSGLALRRKFIKIPCGNDIFTTHMYPFADIFKKHRCVFLKDYTVAIGIRDSQSRNISSVYDKSLTETWVAMFKKIYSGKKYEKVRKICITHIVTHFTGLVQLKNFAKPGVLEREIMILIKYRWQNIFHPKFWIYIIISLLIPGRLLLFFTDNYKRYILSKSLSDVKFNN